MSEEPKLMADWPRTTRDEVKGRGREWIHEEIPRYYLHKYKEDEKGDGWEKYRGKWVVIDRLYGVVDGKPHTRKADCIKAFARSHASSPTEKLSD